MHVSIISSFLVAPIIGSLAAPTVEKLHPFHQVNWARELLGEDHALEPRARTEQSMDAIFKSLGKQYFGTCADSGTLGRADNAAVIVADFGQVTPENSGKWDTIESSQGKFNFGGLDTLVNWAVKNNKLVRGHTTVWYSQLPSWVSAISSKDTLTKVIETHVSTEIGRYAGKILQWDVVNEMFDEQGGLRQSVFAKVLGEDFVRIAFEAARKADPAAKLYINDYNTVEKGSNYAKTTGMIKYVKKWIAAGVPIDGIGAQCHLQTNEAKNVPASLQAICGAAKECALTEVDIAGASASDYVIAIKACVDIPNCVGATIWGVRDSDSWRSSNSPLLFDGSYNPKAAYNALVSTLGALPKATAKPTSPTTTAASVKATTTM